MTQSELHRALSRATGEPVGTLRRLGFSLLDNELQGPETDFPDAEPRVVDWDELEADRMALAIQA